MKITESQFLRMNRLAPEGLALLTAGERVFSAGRNSEGCFARIYTRDENPPVTFTGKTLSYRFRCDLGGSGAWLWPNDETDARLVNQSGLYFYDEGLAVEIIAEEARRVRIGLIRQESNRLESLDGDTLEKIVCLMGIPQGTSLRDAPFCYAVLD